MIIRKLLIRIFVFSLPVLGGLLTLELIQRRIPNNYTHKKALLESNLPQIETLILGSSHTYLAVNPEYLSDKAFNLSATAQTLYYDHYLLSRYVDQMPSLKTVIVPVSYPSLGAESDLNPGDFNRSYHYAMFYGAEAFVSPFSPKLYSVVNLFTIKSSVDRAIAYYTGKDSLVEFRRNGWFATEEQKDLAKNGKDVAPYHDSFYSEDLIPKNTERVADMIRICQARGINIILISPPMYHSYMENITPSRYDRMVAVMDSLSQEFQVNYFNFTNDRRFVEEDFFDSNHLRTRGAAKFTPILDSLILDIERVK